MKERPILFSGPMVRALLEGRKTQTRRVAKEFAGRDDLDAILRRFPNQNGCPYGKPGDRLVVRETWNYADWTDDGYPYIGYQADGAKLLCEQIPTEWSERLHDIWAALSADENYAIDNRAADRWWRPSIHMPRWASRITLEITGARVEWLQEISEADAKAEGTTPSIVGSDLGHLKYRAGYQTLWESINEPGSWNANPCVWVIEFRQVQP